MKIVTIGRSIDNDVCINDPYVGRHHCQIVQHDDGVFAIVDMNSTNGTFVNGRRIFGEAQLQPDDSVIIGHTTLPWGSYFPPKTKSYALPIVLGCVGWALLTIVLTLLFFRHGSDKAFAFKGEYPDAVVVNMANEDGTPYTIEAIEGQVCVWFEEGIPYKTAKKSIKTSGGRIVAQIPENGYYLVEVPADKENVFLNRIKKENFVDRAYPNMVYYPCAVNNYILDNFNPNYSRSDGDTTPHGDIVQYALQEYAEGISLMPYNIGAIDGQYMNNKKYFENGRFCPIFGCTNSEVYAIKDISKKTGSEPIIINMSFGPALPERMINDKEVGYYWNKATDDEKQEYRERYLLFMKETIKNLEPLNGKDFVVVKSAGNSGVKTFDKDIIAYLRDHLSTREKEVMDKHFLLVAAGETERMHQDYSNEMESGHYDPWVTKTDISDFKFEGKKRKGTSFAAPRTAGILSSVANEMNLTASEVLKLAREVTKRDGELTKEALLQTANEIKLAIDNNEVTIEGVLRMYLLDNMGGGSVTYYTDKDGNVISAVGEDDLSHPYCQTIYEYRETDFDNTYLAFVVETDKRLDVTPYVSEFDLEYMIDNPIQTSFMLVPRFQCSERDFASKYANKRVRVTGTLYVPGGGWRNATEVVMDLHSVELVGNGIYVLDNQNRDSSPRTEIQQVVSSNLVGTKWLKASQTVEQYGVMLKSNRMEWEFMENGFVEITVFYESGAKEINRVYKYYFDKESNNWMMWNWGAVEQIGRLEGETNETVLRERAYKQGLYYTLTLNGEKLFATDFSGYEQYDFTRMN